MSASGALPKRPEATTMSIESHAIDGAAFERLRANDPAGFLHARTHTLIKVVAETLGRSCRWDLGDGPSIASYLDDAST